MAARSPTTIPLNDQFIVEALSKTPLAKAQPKIAKSIQNTFVPVIFSLNRKNENITTNIGARLKSTADSERDSSVIE